MKRLLDLAVSVIALVVLAPVFLVIAILIRLDSSGPVFFRQERIGRGGIGFRIRKFRTMRHEPTRDVARQITPTFDPRITRIGRVLRRWKLDELPQLIDVAQGTMSLVGPRPEVPRYVALYPPDARDEIFTVRPGITDFASIVYSDEGALLASAPDADRLYVEEILPHKIALARQYVRTRSLGLDCRLVAMTIARVFGRSTSMVVPGDASG